LQWLPGQWLGSGRNGYVCTGRRLCDSFDLLTDCELKECRSALPFLQDSAIIASDGLGFDLV